MEGLQRVDRRLAWEDPAGQSGGDQRQVGGKGQSAQVREGLGGVAYQTDLGSQPLAGGRREEFLARKAVRLAPTAPGVVADPFFDDVAAVAFFRCFVGLLGHFFAVAEEVALKGLEAVASLGLDFDSGVGWQVGVPFDEADAAGAAEEDILRLQFDLCRVALAVEDEELGGAVVLFGPRYPPQQEAQWLRRKAKVKEVVAHRVVDCR